MSVRQRKPAESEPILSNGQSNGTDSKHGSQGKKKGRSLLTWDQLPEWRQDNHYIVGGYRVEVPDLGFCAWSMIAYLHNETVNIHTHLWAAVLFVFLLTTVHIPFDKYRDTVTWIDFVGFSIFLISAVFCLGTSATYHSLNCHSEEMAKRWHIMDYIGIVVLIVGSFYPSVYYGFFCDPWPQMLYLTAITIAGGFAMYVVLTPFYAQPSYRWARTSVFLALGLAGLIPISHGMLMNGYDKMRHEMGLDWLLVSGALYVLGALIYAGRVPERFAPGKFDIFFASHQIFHVLVFSAAFCQYMCIFVALNHRHGIGNGLCPSVV